MTNYIPHYTKKKRILARKEDVLRRLVRADAERDKLIIAAEDIRKSRIRVLRSQRATIVPTDDAQQLYDKIDAKIQTIGETLARDILVEFGYTLDTEAE